jgi:hypothetical protein
MLKQYNKKDYHYTALFCEENIWQLIQSLSTINSTLNQHSTQYIKTDNLWTLMISNPKQQVILFNQQANPPNQPIIWDYHVILLAKIKTQFFIFDFDTRLPFCCPLHYYIDHTFVTTEQLSQELAIYIRKIPSQHYLNHFYSNRSHMLNHLPITQFPPWNIINLNQQNSIPLASYLDMTLSLNDKSQLLKVTQLIPLKNWLEEKIIP